MIGVEAAMCELRRSVAVLGVARRLVRSYSIKFMLYFRVWLYRWLLAVGSSMSFSWMGSWNEAMRSRIG